MLMLLLHVADWHKWICCPISVVVPFSGQLKTEDWLSVGAEIRTLVVQAKWYNVHVCSVAKKCFPYPYWMWLRSWFESSSSCTGTWEESEQKWLKWPFGGVSNIGWCSLLFLLLLVAVIPQLLGQWTWISVLSPHLLQNSKPRPPLASFNSWHFHRAQWPAVLQQKVINHGWSMQMGVARDAACVCSSSLNGVEKSEEDRANGLLLLIL